MATTVSDILLEVLAARGARELFGIPLPRCGNAYQARSLAEITQTEGRKRGDVMPRLSLRADLNTEFELVNVLNADKRRLHRRKARADHMWTASGIAGSNLARS
ncbi:MAG: hypothetical protein ACNA7W_03470 [Pseudomonadales bacterium]